MIDQRRFVGVYDGDRPVAAARILDLKQWWLGRTVPMAGIAGVVVAPEYRGRGVGSLLMRGVLRRGLELGAPITALYPATVPVYRYLGYEFGGGRHRFSFSTAELRGLGGKEVSLRQGGPDDAQLLLDLVAAVRGGGRESGLLGWPVDEVREWLGDEKVFCYVADDGFVVYAWDDGDLRVDELVAGSEPTARALWSVVGSGSSIARAVHAYVAPHDPVHLLLGKESEATQVQRWMLRLLDAPAAIAARGWSAAADVAVDLEIDDAELAANSGRWRLTVAGGNGRLEPLDDGTAGVRLTTRGLAALYAGTPARTLRTAGLLTGGTDTDDLRLDTAFAGPTPYTLDYF
jgi:predicted acetyltransferase